MNATITVDDALRSRLRLFVNRHGIEVAHIRFGIARNTVKRVLAGKPVLSLVEQHLTAALNADDAARGTTANTAKDL